jgi:hypothetical protein
MMRTASILALALAAACADSPASCQDVADHVAGLRAAADARTGRPTDGALAASRRRRVLEQCEERKLGLEVVACVMAARDRAAVHACEHGEVAVGTR